MGKSALKSAPNKNCYALCFVEVVIQTAIEQYVSCPYNKEHSAKVTIIFVSAKFFVTLYEI